MMFQRQGYAYGSPVLKNSVTYNVLRVVTKLVSKQTQKDAFPALGSVFDYPPSKMTKTEEAAVDDFYKGGVIQMAKNIASFLQAIPVEGLEKSRPPSVALKTRLAKLSGGYNEGDIDAFTRRILDDIRAITIVPPLRRIEFDPKVMFDRLFVADNLRVTYAQLADRIAFIMPGDAAAAMAIMKAYMESRPVEWLDDPEYADLYDMLYVYFTTTAPHPASPDEINRMLHAYEIITIEEMRNLPVHNLMEIKSFIEKHASISGTISGRFDSSMRYIYKNPDPANIASLSSDMLKDRLQLLNAYYDKILDQKIIDDYTDAYMYGIELKHENDASFDPFSVL
jgi:hypothetical protein